jgi:DNA-binding transcriptional LysR family regulator
VRGRFRANNSDAVRRAALNGHGIALLSHLLVAEDISDQRGPAARPDASLSAREISSDDRLPFTPQPAAARPRRH